MLQCSRHRLSVAYQFSWSPSLYSRLLCFAISGVNVILSGPLPSSGVKG